MGALVAARRNPAIREFYERLLAAGKPKKEVALVALYGRFWGDRAGLMPYSPNRIHQSWVWGATPYGRFPHLGLAKVTLSRASLKHRSSSSSLKTGWLAAK